MFRVLLVLTAATAALPLVQEPRPGYTDTPVLPGMDWRVHDPDRPVPPVVEPGAGDFQQPPSDAVVLFQGTGLDAWQTSADAPTWREVDGAMGPVRGAGDLRTRESFGDCQLHVEFRCPPEDQDQGQGRGNSGIFLMERYEIQVLDSYRNPTYPDGQAAAIYGQYPPLVNASRPPGEWQSYDIVFRAPRFDAEGGLLEAARVTVLHNGVAVQVDRALLGPTSHRSLPQYAAHGPAPIRLQDHGDGVLYRNVWLRRLD